jgi:hypothetical protein
VFDGKLFEPRFEGDPFKCLGGKQVVLFDK